MPNWTHDVPEHPRGPALPIRRTPAYKPLVAIVTSEDLIGTYTHFYHGSTTPCTLPHCPAHDEGLPYRWHAYMTALDCHDGLHFIYEVTALGAENFVAYRQAHASLRGCKFEARRWNNRPNGRILIRTKPADLTEIALPHGPDVRQCMAIIWGLKDKALTVPRRNPECDMPAFTVQPKEDPLDNFKKTG